jgi:hypothetical protein
MRQITGSDCLAPFCESLTHFSGCGQFVFVLGPHYKTREVSEESGFSNKCIAHAILPSSVLAIDG